MRQTTQYEGCLGWRRLDARGQGSGTLRAPAGFTLVELLVVIVIISMLTALLLPAVNSARESGRRAQCINNQHELSLAIQQYDSAKRRLPGYRNLITTAGSVSSWVPPVLQYLGRNDLWEGPNRNDGWRGPVIGTEVRDVRVGSLVCPDDQNTGIRALLTYVVNIGVYNDVSALDSYAPKISGSTVPYQAGVFRDNAAGSSSAISLSNVRSSTTTVLLSERLSDAANKNNLRRWDEIGGGNTTNTIADLGFAWPNYSTVTVTTTSCTVTVPTAAQQTALAALKINDSLPPIHPGLIIMTFCDGHTEALSEDTNCNAYTGLP